MPNTWPLVQLGELLTRRKEEIGVKDFETYARLTIHLNGKGITVRDLVPGNQIGTKKQFIARARQLVLSKIDARNGAFGVLPEKCDNAIITGNFWAFDVNTERLNPHYFDYLTRTRLFIDFCVRASEGTTNRRYLQESKFLAQQIPLPPLDEQRRIVAHMEALAAKIEEARGLRAQTDSQSATLYERARDCVFLRLNCTHKPVSELFTLINGRAFKPDEWGQSGRKIIRIQNLKYPTAPYNRYAGTVDPKHLVRSGDVLFAWSGQVVSLGAHVWCGEEAVLNQHIFNVKATHPMLPRFVQEGFNTLIDQMKDQVRGLEMFHIRKQELDRLLFPDASPREQQQVVAHLDSLKTKAEALKRLQTESRAELNAFLPSILDRAFKGEL